MRLGTHAARLLGWLASLFGDDQERCIFGFWDGSRWRRVDPIPVFRALEADPEFNITRDPKLVDDGDPDAHRRAIVATCRAFGVSAFDGTRGLTETELLLLLGSFWDYCGDLKKKASHTPTSPPPMAPEFLDESPMQPESDCGCASTATMPAAAPK